MPKKAKVQTHQDLSQFKLLRPAQVLQILPISRSTLWAGIKSGKFKAYHLGPRTTVLRADEVYAVAEALGVGQ